MRREKPSEMETKATSGSERSAHVNAIGSPAPAPSKPATEVLDDEDDAADEHDERPDDEDDAPHKDDAPSSSSASHHDARRRESISASTAAKLASSGNGDMVSKRTRTRNRTVRAVVRMRTSPHSRFAFLAV